ncbi:hypothetical protein GO988_21070 [Hymenobacter sp. HMF4947]|uniref:Uncharacterized protein n=1 Tax=Hymenobacter ginkgonis TaxID=2682976 RepID=A0A7K1TL45_9BACT|nr:hypothetical protein [Hymenobacter ginkgonis]MVN78831.1 hypothetical protein [Hymenobacter ginkgonis]
MHYEFRDVGFHGKIMRFIKPFNFNSDGPESAPIDQLIKIGEAIEQAEPDTIVVIMFGQGSTGFNHKIPGRVEFMSEFWPSYRRLPDDYYKWDSAEF